MLKIHSNLAYVLQALQGQLIDLLIENGQKEIILTHVAFTVHLYIRK